MDRGKIYMGFSFRQAKKNWLMFSLVYVLCTLVLFQVMAYEVARNAGGVLPSQGCRPKPQAVG